MHCKKCRIKMRELARSFHKQRKWVCTKCGRARMQSTIKRKRSKRTAD